MTPEEAAAFAASVAGVTERHWARATDAADADGERLSALWAAGADQGWFALGEEDALDAALAAVRELGRVACPLPVADAFVAARVFERSHELAVEHAKTRHQFGQPIGRFGAVQQRVAACQIDVSAGRELLDRAAAAYASGRADWPLQAEIAVEFIALAARRVQFGAHHTLAAVGYFEEHDAPWLFRRVQADIARLAALPPPGGSVADVLVEADAQVETVASLPAFDLGPNGESFRAELRAFLAARARPDGRFDQATLIPAMAERGWFGFGWPPEAGGRNASLAEQVALQEEVTYARAPVRTQLSSVTLLGNSILRHGTARQQAAFLPLIRAGRLHFCLGYSEPEAGSDLASLKTRGGGARLEAPMAGVLGGELAETFGQTVLDIIGPAGALAGPAAPGGGEFEYGLRLSIMYVVGGGTNDIQRGLIARALGLPR
jgi:alkylation response protein AidB-like acyl-CoA dehydrogenase